MCVTVKDFKAGDNAYILKDNHGYRSNDIPASSEIIKVAIVKCGRKYVTVKNEFNVEKQFQAAGTGNDYLIEKDNYGKTYILFRTRQDVDDYLKKKGIAYALSSKNITDYLGYSVEQLDQVAAILDLK